MPRLLATLVSSMFKFSTAFRKVINTTNSVESLNSGYRRPNRARSVIPTGSFLLEALYLATFELFVMYLADGLFLKLYRAKPLAHFDETPVKMIL